MTSVLLATRNRHKTVELAALLHSFAEVEDLSAYSNLPEVDETGSTFEENAVLKAVSISRALGPASPSPLVLADDSGLESDALQGAPGVFSARFAGPKATDADNTRLLLEKLGSTPHRTARFRCVIAIAHRGELLATFDGTCEGSLLFGSRGENGFGYDPIFVPQGYDATFAELPAEIKNTISHRARALEKTLVWLKQHQSENRVDQ